MIDERPVEGERDARSLGRQLWDSLPVPEEHAVGITVGLILHRLKPVRLPRWLRPIGWLLLGVGGLMNAVAVHERGGGDLESPQRLVTHGLHGLTRNPMYVGSSAIHVGAALALSTGWVLATWAISFALVHRWVLIEERQLDERFGREYAVYRGRAPRYVSWRRLRPTSPTSRLPQASG
jgi:protein-S-isoprenylcysteine O-methyltransferase Ste14